jgi:hypothetical protein
MEIYLVIISESMALLVEARNSAQYTLVPRTLSPGNDPILNVHSADRETLS